MYYSINFHESLHFDQLAFTEKHMIHLILG